MQISAIVNAALAKFTAAGAVLVPFDSTPFNQASTAAAQPSGYEQGDVFSRWVSNSGLSTALGGREEGRGFILMRTVCPNGWCCLLGCGLADV